MTVHGSGRYRKMCIRDRNIATKNYAQVMKIMTEYGLTIKSRGSIKSLKSDKEEDLSLIHICIYSGRVEYTDDILSGMSLEKYQYIYNRIAPASRYEVAREYMRDVYKRQILYLRILNVFLLYKPNMIF